MFLYDITYKFKKEYFNFGIFFYSFIITMKERC